MFKTSLAIALIFFVSFAAGTHHEAGTTTSDHESQPEKHSEPVTGVMTNTIDATGNNVVIKNSTILLSKKDRVQLAHIIKEMMASSHGVGPASSMTTEDLLVLLTSSMTKPSMLTHVAGIIDAARSGNTGALVGHMVDLLRVSLPVASAPKPTPAAVEIPASDTPKSIV